MQNLPYFPASPTPPARPRQDPSPFFPNADAMRFQAEWQAHVDAGRIGGNPPCPPEVAARRDANEAVLRRFFTGRG